MSNTVITNYRDLNGPTTKAENSVVVFVNKDGSISVDKDLVDTLINSDGTQGTGISVVRIGQEGKPDDATDTESDDNDNVPHVTLSVDGYFDEPNSIVKYDSGAEMLQSLSIETRENSLVGFQNDHCYTPLLSPSQTLPPRRDSFSGYDESEYEPKPQTKQVIPNSKKITILEQQIIPKGKKIVINPSQGSVILKGNDVLNKPLPGLTSKLKKTPKASVSTDKSDDWEDEFDEDDQSSDSSFYNNDKDWDSDYNDSPVTRWSTKPKKLKKTAVKRLIKGRAEPKQLKKTRSLLKQEIKAKLIHKNRSISDVSRQKDPVAESMELLNAEVPVDQKETPKQQKIVKKEKKTPAHVTALLSDMTSLFSTPDVIRRVSSDGKTPSKPEKPLPVTVKKPVDALKIDQRTYSKKLLPAEIPQIDDASLAQILQDPPVISTDTSHTTGTAPTTSNTLNSPNSLGAALAGPLSPTLDLLAGLQTEEEGLTEDLLMHVAQLVESSDNLKEVIDKQVLGKVDTAALAKAGVASLYPQQLYSQSGIIDPKLQKPLGPRKDPVQIVRSDGRVITLPPIEAPATRASKRKNQGTPHHEPVPPTQASASMPVTPDLTVFPQTSKQYSNKKKQEPSPLTDSSMENLLGDDDTWNSEDDPNRLWCICRQPHNNRFMICCDSCEDWFHGKCVNITKAMGQQMEDRGIEWTCPNCIKKAQPPKTPAKATKRASTSKDDLDARRESITDIKGVGATSTNCIVCKNPARTSSIYCSDACILKHAQDSLSSQSPTKPDAETMKTPTAKPKSESRVIVFERKTGRCLAGPKAPTAENLKSWLQKNPTFEVVRPGTLTAIKPTNTAPKKLLNKQPGKAQTTLKFERIPKQAILVKPQPKPPTPEVHKLTKTVVQSPQEEKPNVTGRVNLTPRQAQIPKPSILARQSQGSPKTPGPSSGPKTPGSLTKTPGQFFGNKAPQTSTNKSPGPSTTPKTTAEPRKPVRLIPMRQQIVTEKQPPPVKTPTAPTPRRKPEKEPEKQKSMSQDTETIRDNVKKALQEHMSIRMSENKGEKFSESQVRHFAIETEAELHKLFPDVGIKYKAKYRSLIFNIKDRKNLTLWEKICDKTLSPKQLVRLSPEELASQELAQWRDKEAKYQLELIKKSEMDLLAANKTYVLKTHKGEEVMEQTSATTELDPNVAVEDLVTALNDSNAAGEERPESPQEKKSKPKKSNKRSLPDKRPSSRNKRIKEERSTRSSRSKKSTKEKEEKDFDRKSRSSRRRSHSREKSRNKTPEKSDRKSVAKDGKRSVSQDRKTRSRSRSKHRLRSRSRSGRRSRSRGRSWNRSRSRSRRSRSKDISERGRSKHRSRSKYRMQSQERVKRRSASEVNDYESTEKSESKDTETVERPKSEMQKEFPPEYDPHEPMITSAVSEEDVGKSREDYDEAFGSDNVADAVEPLKDYVSDAKPIDTVRLSSTSSQGKPDKLPSEAESDQEPSSTVDSSALAVWNGCINMVDVARFYVAAHTVSGQCTDLEEDLSAELDIVGRINPETVWDYINKMKRAGNKDIVMLRLTAANDEEKMQYIALYSYLSSRNRLGVVKVTNTMNVKDFYILPIAGNMPIPAVLLPFDGPGFEEPRGHLLVAIIVRQKKKRLTTTAAKDVIPAKVGRGSRTRSYTPPVATTSGSSALPLPYASPALSSSVKDKIAATLASAEDDEPYSPGSSTSSGSAATVPAGGTGALRSKMEELNRQIEEQKQQIRKIAGTAQPNEENEAYSPSRPMTPPLATVTPAAVPLADIALPSNLQEILASIQQRTTDLDMRKGPPPMPKELQQPPPSAPGSLHALTEEELLRMVPDDQ